MGNMNVFGGRPKEEESVVKNLYISRESGRELGESGVIEAKG